MTLVPCRACGRHVKSVEHACPFCRAVCANDAKPRQVTVSGRRVAALAAAVTAAVGLGACGSEPRAVAPVYGGPQQYFHEPVTDGAVDAGAQPG